MLSLYRLATELGAPLISFYLRVRKANGKEDATRFEERLGCASRKRPVGPLVWAHGASVGEALSLLPLIGRLVSDRPSLEVLVTTGTVTSARLMAERLPEGSFHQYVPVDRLPYVRRFLEHWRPDLVLWAESEFWPNLITETVTRNTPMILINGRISPRSFAGWRQFSSLIKGLLGGFRLCLGQTEADAERLRRLGAPTVRCVGDLKFAGLPLPVDEEELASFKEVLGDRPVWLASNTHSGEEEIAATVHRQLKAKHPGLLSMIAPRHPDRGPKIAAQFRAQGLVVGQRSAGDAIGPETDVYLADTMGELGLFYRLVGIAFIGKSLVPLGGQNPLEAARLDCAIIHGPHMMNFEDITRRLNASDAAAEVADEKELEAAVARLLDDGSQRDKMAGAAEAFAAAEAGVLDAVLGELEWFLKPLFKEESPRASA